MLNSYKKERDILYSLGDSFIIENKVKMVVLDGAIAYANLQVVFLSGLPRYTQAPLLLTKKEHGIAKLLIIFFTTAYTTLQCFPILS